MTTEIAKPKNPISPFNYYGPMIRSTVKEQHPTLINNDLNKLIGAKWKALSTQEKQPFVDMANADKRRYLNEVDAYNMQTKGDIIASRIKKGHTGVNSSLDIPTPRNSYGVFTAQECQFVSSLGKGLNINLQPLTGAYMGARWKHMCAEEMNLYELLAKSEMGEYQMRAKEQNKKHRLNEVL